MNFEVSLKIQRKMKGFNLIIFFAYFTDAKVAMLLGGLCMVFTFTKYQASIIYHEWTNQNRECQVPAANLLKLKEESSIVQFRAKD